MSKIGRNEPCPCGSGKKHKRCCEAKERARPTSSTAPHVEPRQPARANAGSANDLPSSGRPLMRPYTLAKIFESSRVFADMKRREPKRAREYWTPGRMAALETDRIVERLRRLGVDGSREALATQAAGHISAWDLSNAWKEGVRSALSRREEDFLGLAACELWKRHCPERPSVEMLDDWMQEGYGLLEKGEHANACELWWQVWVHMRRSLRPEMRTCDAAGGVFDGTQCLFNWIQDFAMELGNSGRLDPAQAALGVELCEDVLRQFSGEDPLFVTNFRSDLGELLFLAGRREDSELVLRELIREHPSRASGYVRLADILGRGRRSGEPPIDLDGAIDLLEQGLGVPVADAGDWDLESRLEELRSARPR